MLGQLTIKLRRNLEENFRRHTDMLTRFKIQNRRSEICDDGCFSENCARSSNWQQSFLPITLEGNLGISGRSCRKEIEWNAAPRHGIKLDYPELHFAPFAPEGIRRKCSLCNNSISSSDKRRADFHSSEHTFHGISDATGCKKARQEEMLSSSSTVR